MQKNLGTLVFKGKVGAVKQTTKVYKNHTSTEFTATKRCPTDKEMLEIWVKTVKEQYLSRANKDIYIKASQYLQVWDGIEHLAAAAEAPLEVMPLMIKTLACKEDEYRASFEYKGITFFQYNITDIWG